MLLQNTHCVVDCPICGRPLELQPELLGQEMACGHCRGQFFVRETDDSSLAAVDRLGTGLMARAELLLRATRGTRSLSIHESRELSESDCTSPLEQLECQAQLQPTALIVEHRDEVFARIATDIAEFGIRVVRATSAAEALALCGKYEPVLVVASVGLPDHSGWLLACKWRCFDKNTPIWLYQARSSDYDLGMAKFSKIDELLDHEGNLFNLSATIIELTSNWRDLSSGHNEPRRIALT